jgi:hypothetical protein
MDAFTFISRIRQAGFTIELTDGNLAISPASELTDERRAWVRAHKPELVAALRESETILESGQASNDIEPGNDRVTVHVPELTLSTGQRISCDMTVPVANLDKLRAVIKFTLKDGGGGGSVLGSPGTTEAELREILREKYGARLATINGAAP